MTETASHSGAEPGSVWFTLHPGKDFGGQSRKELCYTPREKGPKEDAAILRRFRGVTSSSREAIFSLREVSVRQILEAVQFWYLHF